MSAKTLTVEAIREVAHVRIDSLGYAYCDDCNPKYEVIQDTPIYGPMDSVSLEVVYCDTCGRNCWEAHEPVTHSGLVEFVPCKIF